MRVDGISIRDQFLAPSQIRALVDCAHLRHKRGDFDAARIGSDRSLQRRQDIRGDSTCWIAPPLLAAERTLMEELERLRLELNCEALLGLFELELYLNEVWTPAAGGELRIFDAADGHRDIEPIAGRLVCFLTPGREHAVLPTQRDRLSISGWFRARD